ncbi:MAG: transporter, partial [Burkholderiaceae bacterium]|nr:transporter [Burkholderiaceae bacterium]
MIVHGAWKYFALVLMVFVLFKAWRLGKENTIASLAAFMKTRSFVFIFIGLLIVLIYSRLFGMGELWKAIMGDNFNRTVKNIVEE